jgi:hypothetical protein
MAGQISVTGKDISCTANIFQPGDIACLHLFFKFLLEKGEEQMNKEQGTDE